MSIMDRVKCSPHNTEYVLPAVTFLAAGREHEEADRSLDEQISYLPPDTSRAVRYIDRLPSAPVNERLLRVLPGKPRGSPPKQHPFHGSEDTLTGFK